MKEGVSSTLNENVADEISPKTGLSWRLGREKLKGSTGWSMLGFGMGWLKEIDPCLSTQNPRARCLLSFAERCPLRIQLRVIVLCQQQTRLIPSVLVSSFLSAFSISASYFATSEQMEIDNFGWLSVYKEAGRSNQWVEARCWAAAIMDSEVAR
jgi:hypothetical protein